MLKKKKNGPKRKQNNKKNEEMIDIKKSEEKINMLQDLLKNNLFGMGNMNEENSPTFNIEEYKDYEKNILTCTNKIKELENLFKSFENLTAKVIEYNFEGIKKVEDTGFNPLVHNLDYYSKRNEKEINDNIKIIKNNMKPINDLKDKSLKILDNIKENNKKYYDQEIENLIKESVEFREISYNNILYNKFK